MNEKSPKENSEKKKEVGDNNKSGNGKRLSPATWAKIIALWESGEWTLEDLHGEFGVSKETLSRTFTKKGVKKGARADEVAEAVTKEIKKNAVDDAAVLAKRIRETKEEQYRYPTYIARAVAISLNECEKNSVSPATKTAALKALDLAARIFEKTLNQRWKVLGLEDGEYIDEDDLPELHIQKLTDDDIAKMQNEHENDALLIAPVPEPIDNIIEEDFDGDDLVSEDGEND